MLRRNTFWLAWVLLTIGAAYANSFENGFHFDDFHTVVDNPSIRSLASIPSFFTDATTFSVLPANRSYRPIVSTSLALDYAAGQGYAPFWFHVPTFALFLLQVSLLFGLYRMLLDRVREDPANRWLALFAAAWYGLHPAMAETVNYVIQRGDLYCTLGCVASLYVFARWPRLRRRGLYLLPLAFALLSKPPAAVFPFLLMLYKFFFETGRSMKARDRWRISLRAILPSLALTASLIWLQSAMTPKTFMPSIVSPWSYRLTQPFVWMRYFSELFVPIHLNVDTDLVAFSTFDAKVLAGLLFLLALTAAILYTAQRRVLYPIAFGLLWFVVTQLPTSLYPLSEVENDHRMFFSFAGLVLAAVWAVGLLLEAILVSTRLVTLRPWLTIPALLLLCAYGYGTHIRNAVWHDEESLWRDDVAKSPRNGRGLMIYGLTQMKKGAYPVALDYFERALAFTPDYATLEINLGIVNGAMADQGDRTRSAEAERHFLRAVALQPDDDTTHAYYGRWLAEHAHPNVALKEIERAIALNPARMFQRELLVQHYGRTGDLDKAKMAARDLLAIAPTDAVAQQALANTTSLNAAYWINLSLVQYRQGLYAQSIESAHRALDLDPRSAIAWNNIAANEGALHRWDEGIHAAQIAISLEPSFQLARNNLTWSLSQRKLATR